MAMQSSYLFFYLPSQSSSSASDSSVTTVEDDVIPSHAMIDLVSLEIDSNNYSIGSLIDSPFPFY